MNGVGGSRANIHGKPKRVREWREQINRPYLIGRAEDRGSPATAGRLRMMRMPNLGQN